MKVSSSLILAKVLLIAPFLFVGYAAAQEQSRDGAVFSGQFDLGVRVFTNEPDPGERAKFEQYGEIPSGLFLDNVNLVSDIDGFVSEFWASDVGFNNQRYQLRLSSPGNYYLSMEYSELPHVYSTQARTLYDTSNPAVLRVPDTVQLALETAPNDLARAGIINFNTHQTDVAIVRETSRIGLRWTPTPQWDVRLSYSHEDRNGTLPFGTPLNGFNAIELPAPVSYTTQNFAASAQYVGRLSEDRHWSVSLAYNGSLFHNDYDSFIYDNPFRLSAPIANNTANEGRNSLPPSNQAHRYTLTTAVDLPFSSRYVGTVSISQMQQNEPFLPFTINPTILSTSGIPMTNLSLLPARSLHGKLDELLIDNVLTMNFGREWSGTARLRHIDVDNDTPRLLFTEYVRADGQRQNDDRQNYLPAYKRTTTSVDLNWRFQPGMMLGSTFGWDRYDRDNRDADITDEYSGKVFINATPENIPWLRYRASVLVAERRYEDYDALNNVGILGYPPAGTGFLQNPLLRKFDMADRDRVRVDGSAELAFDNGIVISPTLSWRNDQYGDNLANGGDLGLKDETYWNAGFDLSLPIGQTTTLVLSYLHEDFDRAMVNRQRGGTGTTGIACPNLNTTGSEICNWGSEIVDGVDTVYATTNFPLTADLELDLGATYALTSSQTDTYALGSALVNSIPQYPEVTNSFQRFDATLTYHPSENLRQSLGWTGELSAKLGYAFERNHMTNWATDTMTPYMVALDAGANRSLFLDALNPNYEAHIVTMTLGFSW